MVNLEHMARIGPRVDTRAIMPPPTQNTLRLTAFFSPSLFMGEGAGGWGAPLAT